MHLKDNILEINTKTWISLKDRYLVSMRNMVLLDQENIEYGEKQYLHCKIEMKTVPLVE
jgi:hypothetical protein